MGRRKAGGRRADQAALRALVLGDQGERRLRVAVYARVSTDEQRQKGTVETQLGKLRARASVEPWDVAGEYVDDGVSGALDLGDRPQGARLLEDARAGRFDTVLIYKLDRLGRKLQVIVDGHRALEAAGVRLHSLNESIDTSSPAGRLIFHVLASIAEMERDVIYERTSGGRDRVAESGKWVTGPIPPGYILDDDGFLAPGPDAELWAGVFDRIANKGSSAQAEAVRLTAEGVPTDRRYSGKVVAGAALWRQSRLLDLLHNPIYKGVREFTLSDGRVSATPCPALVDEATWEKVQHRLVENRTLNGDSRDYLLRGLIRCADCGHAYYGWPHNDRHYYRCGAQARSYWDATVPRCSGRMVPAEELERVVWDRCRWIVLHPGEAIADAQKWLRDKMAAAPRSDTSERQADLERKVCEWQARQDRQRELFRAGLSTLEETGAVVREAQGYIDTLEAELAGLRGDDGQATTASETEIAGFAVTLERLAARLAEVEATGDRRLMRQVVETLVAGVLVTTTGEGRYKEAVVDVVPNLGEGVSGTLATRSAPASPDGSVWSNPGNSRSGR
jgi:site-specific DNA recombinase